MVNGQSERNLTIRHFCLQFTQTVNKRVSRCKWKTTLVFVTLDGYAYQKSSHKYSNENYLDRGPYRTDQKTSETAEDDKTV